MSNVPVIQSVRAAEAFRRLNWRRVSGVLAVVALGGTLSQAGAIADDQPLRVWGEVIYVVSAVAAYAALMRLAFADEHPDDPEFVPGTRGFQWGRPEWRLVGVGLLMMFVLLLAVAMLIFVGILALVVLGVGAMSAETTPEALMESLGPGGQLTFSFIVLAFVAGVMFVSVRLSLAAPATIARKQVVVFQTWKLTKGQFWRILAATILVGLPAVAAGIVLGLVLTIFGQPGGGDEGPQLAMPGALLAGAIPALVSAYIVLPLSAGLSAYLYRGLRARPDTALEETGR